MWNVGEALISVPSPLEPVMNKSQGPGQGASSSQDSPFTSQIRVLGYTGTSAQTTCPRSLQVLNPLPHDPWPSLLLIENTPNRTIKCILWISDYWQDGDKHKPEWRWLLMCCGNGNAPGMNLLQMMRMLTVNILYLKVKCSMNLKHWKFPVTLLLKL